MFWPPSIRIKYGFLFLVFIACHWAQGQNLGAIGKSNPLKISGGVSANQIFYAANGINARRNPYSYFLSGNVNFNMYEFNVPVSFNFSNQNISVQQPFNQVSLHPVYKWATAHIGFVSMTFSPYTLSGHIFKGAGIDLIPNEKLKISAMYGRLLRAVLPDTTNSRNQPSFAQYGYGTKVTYGSKATFLELTAFRAKDDINSLPQVPEQQNVLPQENLVLSAGGGISIFEKVTLKYELANSAITTDTRAEASDKNSIYSHVGPLFTPRFSTSYYNAMKGSATYNGNGYALGVGYERIDPQYKTLGAYYFNNDMENITVNVNTSLLGGKANLGGNVGTQRDNLDGSKISTMRRAVGSVNLALVPNQNLNINLSYSNFQTYTNVRSQFVNINQLTPYDNLDTLNFTQISQNANANLNYTLKASKEQRQNLFANVSVMKAADKQASVTQNSGSTFININAGYSLNIVSKNLTISPTYNLSKNESLSSNSVTTGPSLSISKTAMEKKLRLTLSGNANRTYTESRYTNQIITLRTILGYVIKKKHNINVSLVGLDRNTSQVSGMVRFKEFTGTVGYSYSF
jgi:hypothetical protein